MFTNIIIIESKKGFITDVLVLRV